MVEKIIRSVKHFLPLALMFLVLSLFVRVYEYAAVSERVTTSAVVFSGIIYDLKFILWSSFLLCVVYVLLSFLSDRLATIIVLITFSLALLLEFALTKYFTVTLIPLSSDLFGYSFDDVVSTVNASDGISFQAVSIVVLSLLFFNVVAILAQRKLGDSIPAKATLGLVVVMLVLAMFIPTKPEPGANDQMNDEVVYLETSKTNFFIEKSYAYLFQKSRAIQFDSTGYPFMQPMDYRSELAQFFKKTDTPPNIVIVIIEGLGRDFVGADAHYGGFTPFIDSLTSQSLYWENCLSNAGRTFGALPSLLGSLPYGEGGFLSYAPNLPEHQTLISLLKPNGYTANFFYGGNSNFDNMDVFLELQGIDYVMNEQNFPQGFTRMKENAGGFSWGYGDADVFQASLKYLSRIENKPRIDVYLTLTTHEPFISPDHDAQKKFESTLDKLNVDEASKSDYRSNSGIYSCLLYTDNALRDLIAGYQKRQDFANTIFVITGDHRLIPVVQDNRLSRFHVPLLIYSPLISSPKKFSGIVLHSDLPPSILSLLSATHGFSFAASMPFISRGLSVKPEFSSNNDIALIRNKNETIDYIEGELFLSDKKLFQILPGLDLKPLQDQQQADRLENKLDIFKSKSVFVIEHNTLDNSATKHFAEFSLSAEEKQRLDAMSVDNLNGDLQFKKAQEEAHKQQYNDSRLILKQILIQNPNHLDARILMARTFAWEQQYDTAFVQLERVKNRAPSYTDTYAAMSDVLYWQNEVLPSLKIINEGLKYDSLDPELRARRARALFATGKKEQARIIVANVLKEQPENELAQDLIKKLK